MPSNNTNNKPASKTLTSFYNSQNLSNLPLPNFTFGSTPVNLKKFPKDIAKKTTIKCIKISSALNKDNSIKFICGKSKNNNSKRDFLEWIKDDEIGNLIENFELKENCVYEVFLKKLNVDNDEDTHKKEDSIEKNLGDLKELTEHGVISAQLILGLLYAKCIESAEIEQDDNKALELFKKVSEQESLEGNVCLGYMYSKEGSSTYNSQEAFAYYTKAADQGSGIATRNLAIMRLVGEYTVSPNPKGSRESLGEQNLKESVKLFRKAINQFGDGVSGNILGLLYQNGIGVPKSVHEATKYYKKASDLNDVNAKVNLGLLLYNGEVIEKNETEGVKLFKEAAENGFVGAQMLLAKAYESEKGKEHDYEKAFEWYSKVAERDDVDYVGESQFCLGKFYEKGLGVKEKDLEKALHWYNKSAENNYLMAQVALADMYRSGDMIDEGKALKWCITAARRNNSQAQFALGELYENGLLGVNKDEKKALEYYKKSAEQGYMTALLRLGIGSELVSVLTKSEVSKRLENITEFADLPSAEEFEKSKK